MGQDLSEGVGVALEDGQTHYLRTVMRRQAGDRFRVFNGRDGEWLVLISDVSKKGITATTEKQIAPQPENTGAVHLLFVPIKKHRMDILIEKAVELGVTDIHPVLSARADLRAVNQDRLEAQVREAAEQCERFVIPRVHPLVDLKAKIRDWPQETPLYACIERGDNTHINDLKPGGDCGFVIGPTGGFDDGEIEYFTSQPKIKALSLGKTVYRAETAAIICLVHAQKALR